MKKFMAILFSAVLILNSFIVYGAAEEKTKEWNSLKTNLAQGLENMEYNGQGYVGYKGTEVYTSKDAIIWEKVFTPETETSISDVFVTDDGSTFVIQGASGDSYVSKDGSAWEKSDKKLVNEISYEADYKDNAIKILKEGESNAIPAKFFEGLNVNKVKIIDNMLVVFASKADEYTNTVYYADISGKGSNKVVVDGKLLTLDVEPTIVENRMLVPIRAIAEQLGCKVSWDEDTSTVTLKNDTIEVVLQIESNIATVNGTEKKLDVPAKLINDRTMIPVRFVSESLEAEVVWDYMQQKAVIRSAEAIAESKKAEDKKTDSTTTSTGAVGGGGFAVGGGGGGGSSSSSTQAEKQAKLQEIKDKYTAQANELSNTSMAQLDAIIQQAKDKYHNAATEEEKQQVLASLISDFTGPVTQIETETDAKFTTIINNMKAELTSNGLSLDSATQLEADYNAKKNAKYEELMNKFLNISSK